MKAPPAQIRSDNEAVRVTVISDTHMQHERLSLPEGDLLIHCGDIFDLYSRNPADLREMDAWFARQPFDKIVCTGGNHDHLLEHAIGLLAQPFRHAQYLQDQTIRYRGLSIFGAPWVPGLPTHAFPKSRSGLEEAWARIPTGVDILITHTPPRGILDRSSRGLSFGCPELASQLQRISPKVHCFGHVHASAGQTMRGQTLFINAASVGRGATAMRPPISFSLKPDAGSG